MEADGGDGTDTVGAASINGEVCIELLLLEEVFRRDGSGDCAGETHDLMREDSGGAGAGGRALPSRPSVEDAGGDDGGRCLVERMLDASDDTVRLTQGELKARFFFTSYKRQVAKPR